MILLFMIFIHIVIYPISVSQSGLVLLRRPDWWAKTYNNNKFRYEYLTAILFIGFVWSMLVHIPVMFISSDIVLNRGLAISILVNGFVFSTLELMVQKFSLFTYSQKSVMSILQIMLILIFLGFVSV